MIKNAIIDAWSTLAMGSIQDPSVSPGLRFMDDKGWVEKQGRPVIGWFLYYQGMARVPFLPVHIDRRPPVLRPVAISSRERSRVM